MITGVNAGIRRQAGTVLKNDRTGEIVYEPPQEYDTIIRLLSNLERYINEPQDDLDPLVRMAIIHYQFESIHPFLDGNGRTGRILNILYLVLTGLLDLPVLYLSRYIINHKSRYYELFSLVNEDDRWEEWIDYILESVIETSRETIDIINRILDLMSAFKHKLRNELQLSYYSKDLLESLFKHPYTKIAYMEKDLGKHYQTVRKYLEELAELGILSKERIGKENFYINTQLLDVFLNKTK